jgi:hypothetical protein
MNMSLAMDYPEDSPGFWLDKLNAFIEQSIDDETLQVPTASAHLMLPEHYIRSCLADQGQITGPTKFKLLIASNYALDIQTLILSMSPAARLPWMPVLHNHHPERSMAHSELIAAYLKLKKECKEPSLASLNVRLGIPATYRHTQSRIPPAGVVAIYELLLLRPSISTLIESLPASDRDGYIQALHWSTAYLDGTHTLLSSEARRSTIMGRLTSTIRLTREQHDIVSDRAKVLGISKAEFMSRAIAYAIEHSLPLNA